MGLRIQHNIAALNAHRQLTIADRGLSKSLERLSSGYRINSAADDATGLAIANAMKADIASFKVASRNTSEATALLQVASGGLSQIADMLTRLKELATQAASANAGSNRTKADTEASKVIAEIDRIANSTEYADEKLINGTFGVSVLNTNSVTQSASGYSGISGMTAGYTYVFAASAGTGATLSLTGYNASGTVIGEETQYSVSIPSSGNTTAVDFNALGVTLTIN
ncbi:MAG: flagellin, partial [Deltaproteobacteria bacterium]|nr:flagellin [Deltaproteobacteria bacterium]